MNVIKFLNKIPDCTACECYLKCLTSDVSSISKEGQCLISNYIPSRYKAFQSYQMLQVLIYSSGFNHLRTDIPGVNLYQLFHRRSQVEGITFGLDLTDKKFIETINDLPRYVKQKYLRKFKLYFQVIGTPTISDTFLSLRKDTLLRKHPHFDNLILAALSVRIELR